MKIQILNDIAQEFSINWNSEAMEEKLNISDSSLHVNLFPFKNKFSNRTMKWKERCLQEKTKQTSLNLKYISNEETLRLQSSGDDDESTDISSQDCTKTRSSSLGSFSEDDDLDYTKKPSQHKIVPRPCFTPEPDVKEPAVQDKPKPKSVRTRGLRTPRCQKKKKKNVSDIDSRDEDDRKMDRLLTHYSMKISSPESKGKKQNTIRHMKSDSDGLLTRGTSLPAHHLLASVEPEMQSEGAKHVHPKLPDYDEFAARLASIRGR